MRNIILKCYPPKQKEREGTVDTVTTEEINKDFVFTKLVNPLYIMKDNKVSVSVTVKYLDRETIVTQFSQYELVLEKAEN